MPGTVHDTAEEFARVAKALCTLIEARRAAESGALQRGLLELHLAALSLPGVEPSSDDAGPGLAGGNVSAEVLSGLPVELYWDVFDPLSTPPEEPVANSAADDLQDIYSDVKRGLALFDQGLTASAVWHWRFTFDCHWGEHLVGLVRAVHLASRGGERSV